MATINVVSGILGLAVLIMFIIMVQRISQIKERLDYSLDQEDFRFPLFAGDYAKARKIILQNLHEDLSALYKGIERDDYQKQIERILQYHIEDIEAYNKVAPEKINLPTIEEMDKFVKAVHY